MPVQQIFLIWWPPDNRLYGDHQIYTPVAQVLAGFRNKGLIIKRPINLSVYSALLSLGQFCRQLRQNTCTRRSNLNMNETYSNAKTMLRYRRETALQGALVLAKSGRLELGTVFSVCYTDP